MIFIFQTAICLWLFFNLIVVLRYTPNKLYEMLVTEQTPIGRICGNVFYIPAWVVMFLICLIKKFLKALGRRIRYVVFAVLRFLQQVYHSIIDIL